MRAVRVPLAVISLIACTDLIVPTKLLAPSTASNAVTASAAKLVINELMPDPTLVTDANGEWFEVANIGGTAINIQNYIIASGNDTNTPITASVNVPAGGYVVLGRVSATGTNGGVTEAYAYGTAITLANTSDWLALRNASGVTQDSVSYTSTTAGKSWSLKDPTIAHASVGGTNWQLATSLYNSTDFGTPNAVNDGYVAPAVATVVVTPSSASVAVNATQQFSAQGYDAGGNPISTTFTWASSNTTVATVSASGLATGIAAGSATITATSANGKQGTAALTVTSGGGGGGSEVIVRVLDVGQGDANEIENGTSKIIIDGGPDTTRFGFLIDSLGLRNSTINAVILSHEHADHHTGLRALFKSSRNITINYFFENKNVYSNAGLQELRDSINARVGRGQLIYRDTDDPCANGSAVCNIVMAGGAKLEVLKPNPAGTTPNNRSAAEKLVGPDSASFVMWFAGDAEQEEIGWFLGAAGYATNPGMKANVLKADHHGSCNGVTNAYVNTVNPSYVTASVGASNTYGHMHNQAKTLYSAHGKPWYRTDQNGTIVFRSPGTVGGGFTVSVLKGVTNMSGPSDATSTQTLCNPIP
ncbi:MAG: Ig-like domain-containing protein [Gemmatimonadota bacterium]|nr:Ig-like domain-containing protein [Gemmatimonadota bacterium]